MYKSIVFICEIANASYLNSGEQYVELQGYLVQDEMEEEKQLQLQQENEGSFFNWKTLGHGVQDEKEEEKQLQLQKENEGSFFNWKTLLLGLGVAAFTAGIVLYETQGKMKVNFILTITII